MIAVTGATGFLGAHLVCRSLLQGKAVRALKRSNSNREEFDYIYSLYFSNAQPTGNLTWMEADILDLPALEDALTGVEEVYHCAAVVSFNPSDKDYMMKANIEGTANVVNTCLNRKIKRLAYISSIAALGREKSGTEITEKTKWVDSRHNSAYAISKYKAEKEVWRGVEEGLDAVIVNPGVILGSGKWNKGSCVLFNMVHKGMPFYTNGVNGYVDVEDVADATLFLMQNDHINERYILVSENMNMKWFLDETATLLGAKKAHVEVKKVLAELSWRALKILSFFTSKKPSITKETARASLNRFYYNSDKIKKLGFSFKPIEKTLQDACTNFKQQQISIP